MGGSFHHSFHVYIFVTFYDKKKKQKKKCVGTHVLWLRALLATSREASSLNEDALPPALVPPTPLAVCRPCEGCNVCKHLAENCLKTAHP